MATMRMTLQTTTILQYTYLVPKPVFISVYYVCSPIFIP